jgi:hypothetical protein
MGNKARVEGLLIFHEHEVSYLERVTVWGFVLKGYVSRNAC